MFHACSLLLYTLIRVKKYIVHLDFCFYRVEKREVKQFYSIGRLKSEFDLSLFMRQFEITGEFLFDQFLAHICHDQLNHLIVYDILF